LLPFIRDRDPTPNNIGGEDARAYPAYLGVAQSGRALGLEPRGRGFKSRPLDHHQIDHIGERVGAVRSPKPLPASSTLAAGASGGRERNGNVTACDAVDAGSIPAGHPNDPGSSSGRTRPFEG
jgi:hypothetical protein